jgi:hypothetical protein
MVFLVIGDFNIMRIFNIEDLREVLHLKMVWRGTSGVLR